MSTIREKFQQKALRQWEANGRVGTVIAATGFGKSKVALDALCLPIRENPEHKSLLLVPTTDLQRQFERNAAGYGYEEEYKRVHVYCFASGHRLKPEHYDTVVVDEVHLSFGPKFSEFYKNNSWDDLLCLTATVPDDEELREELFKIAPPVFNMGLDECVATGLVAPYDIIAVPIALTDEESKKYSDYTDSFDTAKTYFGAHNLFAKAKSILASEESTEEDKKTAYKALASVRARTSILHNAERKLLAAHHIFELLSDKPVKIMTFGESNKQTNQLAKLIGSDMAHAYHSGFDKFKRAHILEDFKKDRFQVLCTTKVANQGISIEDASVGIIIGLTSNSLTLVQRIGRLLRAQPGKRALIIILYIPNTREEAWLKSASKDLYIEYLTNLLEVEHYLNGLDI